MPIDSKGISVKVAVACFFICALAGWIAELSPSVCCKRALIGAFTGYVFTVLALRFVNVIIINAMIANQMNREKDRISDNAD